ncbi:hypothetical protein [Bacillus sp. JCM 19041]|uniref:hypothetical protein n=1 Tax=Bacillus sp. JCM 19041 TaxID=1460637 RepID=UPI0018D15287
MMEDQTSGGIILAIGMITAFAGAAWGLGAGLLLYVILIGIKKEDKMQDKIEIETKKEIS